MLTYDDGFHYIKVNYKLKERRSFGGCCENKGLYLILSFHGSAVTLYRIPIFLTKHNVAYSVLSLQHALLYLWTTSYLL